jgi:hypothetical protein
MFMLERKLLVDKILHSEINDSAKLLYFEFLLNADTNYYVDVKNVNLSELDVSEVDVKTLEEIGMIKRVKDGVLVVTNHILYETLNGIEPNEETSFSKVTSSEIKEVLQDYNSICTSLSPVVKATRSKKEAVILAIKSGYNRYDLMKAFETTEKSDFLCGRLVGATWRANFDWIIKPENIEKILNGNYINRTNGNKPDALGNWG